MFQLRNFFYFRENFNMAETPNVEDLEDGEIESDGEEIPEKQNSDKQDEVKIDESGFNMHHDKPENQDLHYTKPGKKKKNKSKKGAQGKNKNKIKNKNNRKYSSSAAEDDFAGNIEKAIRSAMKRNDNEENQFEVDVDERRKYKKRKKYDGNKDGPSKKRKKQEYSDEMDETEMMCVRGASPVRRDSQLDNNMYPEDERDSYGSDSSEERGQHQHRNQRQRPPQRERNNKNNKNDRRRGGAHHMQDPDGVCLYFMQGKCHKGDDCIYSHDANPPRKMELCKFYLMDCCAKRDKCLYMHADFPCKFYHTGLPCVYKDECKFAHGKPLSDNIKNILLKHIESAPKEILGDFPRLNREGALKMIQTTQAKLIQQYSENLEDQERNIPSLFELNLSNPPNGEGNQFNSYNNDRQNKISPKVRQSRWQNENSNQNYNMNVSPNSNSSNVLNIRNLTGVLTPRQILDLSKMGIDNLDQLGQLTVLQLNSIGLSLKQITEIQLNTMSIQKLGLINNEQNLQQFAGSTGTQDLDLRVPPSIGVTNNLVLSSDLPGKDIDMRFQPVVSHTVDGDDTQTIITPKEPQTNKDLIDIDQYTKDALKFASKDKDNVEISNDGYDNEKNTTTEIKDIDHRVLPFHESTLKMAEPVDNIQNNKESDTDIRFRQPEHIFKSPEKRHRRSTTDDEDNNLLIDEKWYSSDEEKCNKNKKSPASSPLQNSSSPQNPAPHVIEPTSVISRLGDLSKIDISEEVTKLLNTMKNNLNESKNENNSECQGSPKHRDPRSRRLSADKASDPPKIASHKKSPRVSIYECVDGEPTDGRRRTDVDLRKTDYTMPSFGDTDLRQSTSGDIDLRLGLPFKAIPNYTPASEIDGSINSHPPIPFKVVLIDIPRPDYTDIRNSTAKSQALVDPRLRKVFRLSVEETTSDSDKEKSTKATPTGPRVDPRRKPKDTCENPIQDCKQNMLDLQTVLQNSNWFKELSSTQKIFVNQHLAPVSQAIKQFLQEKVPGRIFDVSSLQNNSIICSIFTNLGISLGENGEFSYLPQPKDALLQTPSNFNQNNGIYSMNSNMGVSADGNNMNMMNNMNMSSMNMGGINNMNMGGMHGFNASLPDPRGGPAPGLLGIAPNMPHNYNNNYGGPNNYGNMPYNGPGPGNDFNYMDGEQNFPRFPNRGGHRGRGNERWNRGGSARGNRKGFNERNNWK